MPLGSRFVTPAPHRRHHSREAALSNSNDGTITLIGGRVFHTLHAYRARLPERGEYAPFESCSFNRNLWDVQKRPLGILIRQGRRS